MAKKPTIKELNERVNLVTSQLNFTMRMLDSVGIAFSKYLKFKNEDEDFKKYLENTTKVDKLKEDVKNDTK